MSTFDGGPAFPGTVVQNADGGIYPSAQWTAAGLTKRELFAAMVMQGLTSNGDVIDRLDRAAKDGPELFKFTARAAILLADALLEELAK